MSQGNTGRECPMTSLRFSITRENIINSLQETKLEIKYDNYIILSSEATKRNLI